MNVHYLFAELKRRNVYKVAAACGLVSSPSHHRLSDRSGHPYAFEATSRLVDPLLRGLRDDALYKKLVAKLGFPSTS